MNLVDLVNPLQGTYSHFGFSVGNTLPIVARPFGMTHWAIQTADILGWWFSPNDRKLMGIRCTHQPSPWIRDYGAFVLLPQSGPRYLSPTKRATSYRLDKSVIRPHRMSTYIASTGIEIEMAPTARAAIFQIRFKEGSESRLILDGVKGETYFSVRPDGRTVVGYTRGTNGGAHESFANYFVAVLDQPIVEWATFEGDELGAQGEAATGDRLGICLELGTATSVVVRVGTSFISEEQAERNLQREIGDADFETVAAEGEKVWNSVLGQIEVEETDTERLRTFYSCLYRTQLFPRELHEFDADEKMVHYSPYDGELHDGPLYGDTGFWDTYRTQFPLLSLLSPDRFNEILRGFINAYKESGWFPQWSSPGHRVSMVGTHLDTVFADAVAKGIADCDLETALEGMMKHSESASPIPGAGRPGIEEFLRLGYCLDHSHGSVAQSLDYSYDDWCIAQVADHLGRTEERDRLLARAQNYRKSYDPEVGFMRGKNEDGSWFEPFDPFGWGGPYVEGGPWQSSFAVPHDPSGLMKLMGGEEKFAAKLDEMLETPPYFHVRGYSQEIHEMTEMAMADFGQYAQSNQPVHNVLFLYHAAGRPWRTQVAVRRVMDELYTPDKFPGDEDNGEMAGWYVLNALGIYPHCPGRAEWALGSPLFTRATVHLPNGKDLVIDAIGNDRSHVYVASVSVEDESLGSIVSHAALAAGGTLRFEMSETPNETVVPTEKRLGSQSGY